MHSSNDLRFALSVTLNALDREQQLETMRLLGGSAVKSVELWEPTFNKEEGFVREARQALAAAGVAPRSVHAAFAPTLDLSSPDAAIRAAGMQAIGAALDLAVRMGAGIIVVHPSSEPIPDAEREARLALSRGSIATLAAMARAVGCRIAIELLPRSCLGRSEVELLRLLEGVDVAAAGFCLDTNHLMGDCAPLPEVVRALGPRLFTLHCSDYDGVDEKHWPPLRGVINWGAFLAALREAGYAGPLHYEADLPGATAAERLAFLEANYAQLLATLPR